MKTTYLFKEETANGQKKLRIGTRDEFNSVMLSNKEIGEENRRYFIREKSLDPNQPDLLIIEVDRTEYLEWKKEQVTRSRNYRLGKQYSQLSLERTVHASSQGKLDEPALYGEDPGFEDVLADDEDFIIEVLPDRIITQVFQEIGWVRKNTYHPRDCISEETFEGRWKSISRKPQKHHSIDR